MDDMLDPFGDRVMKNVPMIARHPIARSDLWKVDSKYKSNKINQSDCSTTSSVVCFAIIILFYMNLQLTFLTCL